MKLADTIRTAVARGLISPEVVPIQRDHIDFPTRDDEFCYQLRVGSYQHETIYDTMLVEEKYRLACVEYPLANIEVWRRKVGQQWDFGVRL